MGKKKRGKKGSIQGVSNNSPTHESALLDQNKLEDTANALAEMTSGEDACQNTVAEMNDRFPTSDLRSAPKLCSSKETRHILFPLETLPSTAAETFDSLGTSECSPPTNYADELGKGDMPTASVNSSSFLEGLEIIRKTPFPRRPLERARNGKLIPLYVNCFKMSISDDDLYHYDVEVFPKSPDDAVTKDDGLPLKDAKYRVMNNKLNCIILRKAFETFEIFLGIRPVYDGQKNIYTMKRLNIGDNTEYQNSVSVDINGRTRVFDIRMKCVSTIRLYKLHALFEKRISDVPQDAVMAIDVILRHGLKMNMIPVGNAFYVTPPQSERKNRYLGKGKEAWFGCYQSFRPGETGPILNMDKAATVFYSPMNVIDFVMEVLGRNLEKDSRLQSDDIKNLTSELSQLWVHVTHADTGRQYQIFRVVELSPQDIKFTRNHEGKEEVLTVMQYFREQYKYELKYPYLPCLQAYPEKKQLFLPMEVCEIVDGQHYRKKFQDPAKMITMTATAPEKRFSDICYYHRQHVRYNQPWLKEFGITIGNEPLQLHGRILEAPKLMCGTNKEELAVQGIKAAWNMKDKQFLKGATIQRWAILSLANRNFSKKGLETFAGWLEKEGNQMGMSVKEVSAIITCDQREMEKLTEHLNSLKSKNFELVVIVLQSKNNTYYKVKAIAETDVGIKTQCVLENNVIRYNPSIIGNLLLKINKKMGGINSAINSVNRPQVLNTPTMIVSADVCHSSPGEKRTPSIAAAVATMDFHLTSFEGVSRVQHRMNNNTGSKEYSTKVIELIQDFESMMTELLQKFAKANKQRIPEKIIVYRDGVSEGQFKQVRDHEIRAIREACEKFGGPQYKPKITFVIVDKRHHLRFRPVKESDGAGNDKNIPPGTVIDSVVTHPLYYDFFLCSHLGLRGTSRPVRYCVLWDDNRFTSDELQKLTYYFCYNYSSCNKAVSTPAAAKYADMLADRARQHFLANEQLYDDDEISDLSIAMQAISVREDLGMYFM